MLICRKSNQTKPNTQICLKSVILCSYVKELFRKHLTNHENLTCFFLDITETLEKKNNFFALTPGNVSRVAYLSFDKCDPIYWRVMDGVYYNPSDTLLLYRSRLALVQLSIFACYKT